MGVSWGRDGLMCDEPTFAHESKKYGTVDNIADSIVERTSRRQKQWCGNGSG